MAWRGSAPWRAGRGNAGWGGRGSNKKKAARTSNLEYDVCSTCRHWDFRYHGNWCCSRCGGPYLGDAEQGDG
eukprot:2386655-Pyramimonas_sp.AAC.1